MSSISSANLKARRQSLKRRRQTRIIQAIWRSLCIAGCTGGMVWLAMRPDWVVRGAEQITIDGNTYLSDASVRELLPISYPQALFQIQPQTLGAAIAEHGSIESVTVRRNLFPPGLTIEVVEHQPVAIALPGPAVPGQTEKPDPVGLVDANGFWMPQNSYVELQSAPDLPTLTVVGLSDDNRSHWPGIYASLNRSTIQIFEVDLRSPHNIILKTELGTVHLGPYLDTVFAEQLHTLAQMRQLPAHVQTADVDYIDLRHPDNPAVQLKTPKPPPKQ